MHIDQQLKHISTLALNSSVCMQPTFMMEQQNSRLCLLSPILRLSGHRKICQCGKINTTGITGDSFLRTWTFPTGYMIFQRQRRGFSALLQGNCHDFPDKCFLRGLLDLPQMTGNNCFPAFVSSESNNLSIYVFIASSLRQSALVKRTATSCHPLTKVEKFCQKFGNFSTII